MFERTDIAPEWLGLSDRAKRRLGYGVVGLAGVLVLLRPARRVATRTVRSVSALAGVVTPFLWVALVWVGMYWLWERDTPGEDVLVVAGWVVAVAVNAGLGIAVIVQQQRFVGVPIHEPGLLVNGVAAAGLVNGFVVGYFHLRSREQRRSVECERAELRERSDQLEFVNRLLRHDIRNDVAVIQGYAELLVDEGVEDAEHILRKSHHIEELTSVATDVASSLDRTRQHAVDVGVHLADALDSVRTAYPHAEFEADDLARGTDVTGTPLLESAFENLLRNAVQHNDAETPRIEVETTVRPETVVVRISDNGPGIPAQVRQHLFQPGERGEHSAGMGLGLYLVERLVADAGGDVWIADGDQEGTTFVIELRRPGET